MRKFVTWVCLLLGVLCLTSGVRAEDGAGTLTGLLVAKGDNWIEVRADNAKDAVRYRPRWIGGMPKDGGGFDRAVLQQIKKLRVPNRVRLSWILEEGPRVTSVEMLAPRNESGRERGIVVNKGENWIDIRVGDEVNRYMPRWIGGMPKDGGGLDRNILNAIAATPIGARVSFDWLYQERLRITRLEIIKRD